jgi:23S rRNA maturation-related 3'-5' exoribonuclease YhaM
MDIQIAQEKEARILEAEQEQTERLIDEKMDRNIEMNYYGEQAKKKKHTEFCSGLLDRILDIADEAYQHR